MIMTRHFQSITRILLATMAFAGLAFVAVGAAGSAGSAQAAGLRNCTEMSSGHPRSACWEDVWAGGAEYRMVFATGCCSQFKGKVPEDLDAFYVMAPQDEHAPEPCCVVPARPRRPRHPEAEPRHLQHPVARLLRRVQRSRASPAVPACLK